MVARPLARRRVVTTRDERGGLDSLLARAGADVVHVPLIAIEPEFDPERPGFDLEGFDWLVVSSHHGATAVGAIAARSPWVGLAAVGTRTAQRLTELAGRGVDVVPDRQTAVDLAAAMPPGPSRLMVAQADRAAPTLVTELRARGHEVRVVTAYRTVLRAPTTEERVAALAADAAVFASGSAAEGWIDGIGGTTPSVTVAIGPSTARAAAQAGLQITHVAADHSVGGLVETVITALTAGP